MLRLALLLSFCWTNLLMADDDKFTQALQAAKENKNKEAVTLLSDVIKAEPDRAEAYYWRGRENFRLGQIDKSVADFDKFVALEPKAANAQWERGIPLY